MEDEQEQKLAEPAHYPLTFFSLGFFFLAALEALRLADPRMAPARSAEIPMRFEIPAATFLNPGCLFMVSPDVWLDSRWPAGVSSDPL